MSITDIILVTSLLFAFIATCVIMPWAIKFALAHSLLDQPDERKIHKGNIPRIGGVVFVPIAIIFSAIAIAAIGIYNPVLFGNYSLVDLLMQLLACIFLFVTGTIDDIVGLRYRVKFLVQFIAGSLLCASGLYISNMHGILGIYEIPAFVGWTITLFAVIYCTNALNLIDGVDGQASLIAMTAFAYYFLYMNKHLDMLYTPLCLIFIVALVAFLIFNVFGSARRGTKTFMGDAGSLSLGFVIVMLGIVCCNYISVSPDGYDGAFIKAFAPFFLPCMDVVRVVTHRVRTGHNPFEADRSHIHHKFLDCGLTPRKVTITVVSINAIIIVLSVILAQNMNSNLVILIILGLFALLDAGVTRYIEKNKNKA